MIIYVLRMTGDGADPTYNTAWAGLWLLAEISLATVVACLLSLPKFIEVHRKSLIETLTSISQPLLSLRRFGSSERWSSERSRSKNTATAEGETFDGSIGMQTNSEAHLVYDPVQRPGYNASPSPMGDFSPSLNGSADGKSNIYCPGRIYQSLTEILCSRNGVIIRCVACSMIHQLAQQIPVIMD